MKNPIFAEYYSHDDCICYKIKLPYTDLREEKLILCPISKGYALAQVIALGALMKHAIKATDVHNIH